MKKSLILLFACVQCFGALAQSQGNTKSDEKQRIPITPIVVDGEVTGVPDGTPIVFCYRVKKTREFRNARNTLTTTIQNGKFHIEKKFLYKDDGDSENNVEYILSTGGTFLPVYANPGAKIKI